MKYNREFKLSLSDIDVIETCLSKELHVRSETFQELEPQGNSQEIDNAKQRISEITELLGKIHHQKVWHTANSAKVPTG